MTLQLLIIQYAHVYRPRNAPTKVNLSVVYILDYFSNNDNTLYPKNTCIRSYWPLRYYLYPAGIKSSQVKRFYLA